MSKAKKDEENILDPKDEAIDNKKDKKTAKNKKIEEKEPIKTNTRKGKKTRQNYLWRISIRIRRG